MLNRHQGGAVLATSLIILLVVTLLVIGMLKTSVIELKIGGLAQTAVQNFSNADAALVKFFNDNDGRFVKDCLQPGSATPCLCTNPDPAQCQAEDVNNNNTSFDDGRIIVGSGSLLHASAIEITASQLTDCIPFAAEETGNEMGSSGPGGTEPPEVIFFDVRAVSQGARDDSASVHQGIRSFCD